MDWRGLIEWLSVEQQGGEEGKLCPAPGSADQMEGVTIHWLSWGALEGGDGTWGSGAL